MKQPILAFGSKTFYLHGDGEYYPTKAVVGGAQAPVVKPTICHEPLGTPEVPRRIEGRSLLRFTQFTRRRQDPDNCCPKYHIDWMRGQGWISDDTDDDITLQVSQVQVGSREEEGVLIELL